MSKPRDPNNAEQLERAADALPGPAFTKDGRPAPRPEPAPAPVKLPR